MFFPLPSWPHSPNPFAEDQDSDFFFFGEIRRLLLGEKWSICVCVRGTERECVSVRGSKKITRRLWPALRGQRRRPAVISEAKRYVEARCLGKVKVTHSASGYHTQDTKTRKEKEKKHPVRGGGGGCLVSSVWSLWEPRRAELLHAVWTERIDGSFKWKWALMINLLSVISWLVCIFLNERRNCIFFPPFPLVHSTCRAYFNQISATEAAAKQPTLALMLNFFF